MGGSDGQPIPSLLAADGCPAPQTYLRAWGWLAVAPCRPAQQPPFSGRIEPASNRTGPPMSRRLIFWFSMAAVAGGCAQAVPGYVPPSPKRDKILAASPRGGGFDEGGAYQLTEQEQKLDCKNLNGSIAVKIMQMRTAGDRVEASTASKTLQKVTEPLKKSTTYARDTATDYKQDRARLEALNGRLAEKNCRTFDLEAELNPANKGFPTPVGEAPTRASKK